MLDVESLVPAPSAVINCINFMEREACEINEEQLSAFLSCRYITAGAIESPHRLVNHLAGLQLCPRNTEIVNVPQDSSVLWYIKKKKVL